MTLALAVVLLPFVLLTSCFAIEVFVGLKPLPKPRLISERHPSAVIIVPAHNEEAILQNSLEELIRAAAGLARVVLVADNCTDGTAAIARRLGAEVVERFDPKLRGKGYALDFARTYLTNEPPEAVLIIDADCAIDPQSIERLVGFCVRTERPCQATYLQLPNPKASVTVQLSTFAFYIRNVIRQRSLVRLAGRAHLVGTGMAFTWPIFAGADLATNNIVEDLQLGSELAERGQAPLFCESASVWSSAASQANTMAQRQRWEGGFLQHARKTAPGLLRNAFAKADVRLLWAAINLMVPPFALLIMLDLVLLLVGIPAAWAGITRAWPSYCLGAALLSALLGLSFAWAGGGRRFVSLRTLARAPVYLAWKLPMYVGFARRGTPTEWQRTGREGSHQGNPDPAP